MQTIDKMHPRIAEIARVLLPMIENPAARPTSHDRSRLMDLRRQIKQLPEEEGISLSNHDKADHHYLYLASTQLANQQEDFYEKNGNTWAESDDDVPTP